MNHTMSKITLSALLFASASSFSMTTFEYAVQNAKNYYNTTTTELSKLFKGGLQKNAPRVETPAIVKPVAQPAASKAEVKANIVKRACGSVAATTAAIKAGFVNQTTRAGNVVSAACTHSKNGVINSLVATKNFISAHPFKFTAIVTGALATTGAIGYGVYTYVNQENTEAESAQ